MQALCSESAQALALLLRDARGWLLPPRHYVRFRANEARGMRDSRATGEGAENNNKYLCKCKFRLAKSNQMIEKSVNFNDPSLSNHWVTRVFDLKHNGFLCEELEKDTFK